MISKYIIPFYFFIALFIGLFVAYVSTPAPDIIIKYPIVTEILPSTSTSATLSDPIKYATYF